MRKKQLQKSLLKRRFVPPVLVGATLVSILLSIYIFMTYSSFVWVFLDTLAQNMTLHFRTQSMTLVMRTLSWWGTYGTIAGWIGLTAWFASKRNWNMVFMLLALSIGGYLVGMGIKMGLGRERPLLDGLVDAFSYSLPSLHMHHATIFYVTLTYLVYHFSHHFFRSVAIFLFSLLLILAIGGSRIYLGVHYLSDVVAGFFSGMGYLGIVLTCFRIKEFKYS